MRHSWRLDAKWAVAILFVLCAVAASTTYSLYRITAHEPASGTAASIIGALAKEMVDDELFAELQGAAQASPEAEVQVNRLIVPLTGEEIAGLTKEEFLDKAAARMAGIIYLGGVDAAKAYFQDLSPAEEEPASGDQAPPEEEGGLPLEPLGLFTQETHDSIRPFALGLSLATAALLVVLVLLSRGFGRLGSPGLALLIGMGPVALAFVVMKNVFADTGDDQGGIFPAAARALYPTIDDLSRLFTIIVAVGGAAVAIAVVGHAGFALWRRFRSIETPPEEDTAPPHETVEQPPDYTSKEGFSGHLPGASRSIGPGGVPQA